jgi:sugar O-acyltransferase (sialic acid O-acetyltransferase NeuD family)
MLIVGAGGFAKELVDVVLENDPTCAPVFFDNITEKELFLNQFTVLKSFSAVKTYFDNQEFKFCIGVGGPINRISLINNLLSIGGQLTSVISLNAKIGKFDVQIGTGTTLLHNTTVSNSTKIGEGCLIYHDVRITHDCSIGDFVEIAPGASLLGGAEIGSFTSIGANSTILPRIKVGKNCILGAGSVITKDVPDNAVVAGVPAKIIRFQIP